jgi:hypothetical protein
MSELRRLTSRRAFAAGAGVLAATLGAAAPAAAQPDSTSADTNSPASPTATQPQPTTASPPPSPPPPSPPPPPNSPARARDLGKLSNVLYNNPDQRAAFMADPQGFAARIGVRSVGSADLAWLKNAFADGFCCMGCGC